MKVDIENSVNCWKAEMLISSQTWRGKGCHVGSETTRVSPNNNPLHECRASYKDDDIVRSYGNTNRKKFRIKSLNDNKTYEGEIKSFGDSVTIRTIPAVTTFAYAKGQKITYKAEESAKVELLINKGRGFAFPVNAVDKKQADINFIDAWSKDAGQRIKIAVDTEILAAVYADVASANKGTTAGATSSMYNIGTTANSIALTKANIIEYISYCEQVLTEQNCPEDGRWLVLPGWAKNLLDLSDLKDSSMTGRESTLPNGRIGSLLNFDILVSNCYTAVSDTYNCYHVIFGHKSALTFAAQMDFVETLKNPDDYGDLIRGLMIYGYEVVKPTAMGELYCRRG